MSSAEDQLKKFSGKLQWQLVRLLIITLAYYFLGRVGLLLASHADQVTLIWPSTGIAMFGLLVWGNRMWLAIWVAALLINLPLGTSVMASVVIASGNTLGPVIATWALKKYNFNIAMATSRDVVLFVFIAAIAGMMINASVGSTALVLDSVLPAAKWQNVWLTWWLGDALGALVFGSALLIIHNGLFDTDSHKTSNPVELLAVWIGLFIVGLQTFVPISIFPDGLPAMAPFPFVIWMALRFRPFHSMLAVLIMVSMNLWGIYEQWGPFIDHQNNMDMTRVWTHMLIFGLVPILIVAMRKETENALHQLLDRERGLVKERDLNRQYLDTMQNIMLSLDTEGRVTMLNQAGCELLGCREDELLGKDWFKNCLPENEAIQKVYPVFQQLLRGEQDGVEYTENAIVTRSGENRIIVWRNNPFKDKNGKIIGTLSSGQDITDLQEKNRIVGLIDTSLPGMLYQCRNDEDRTMTFVSKGCLELTGYMAESIIGNSRLSYSDLIHEDDKNRVWEEVQSALANIGSFELEYRIITAEGKEKWVLEHGASLDGQNLKLVGIILDNDAAKRAELVMQESKRQTEQLLADADQSRKALLGILEDQKLAEARIRKLSTVVEQSPESVVITNLDCEIEYVNDSFAKISGYSVEEAIGKTPRILHSGKTEQKVYDDLWDTLGRGEVWKGRFINRRKTGDIYHEFAIISPIRNDAGEISHYLALKEDITNKVQMEQELDQHRKHLEEMVEIRTKELALARDKAQEAARAKSAFLANMSHEIRTPLNAIIGMTHLLSRGDLKHVQEQQLEKILSSSNHLLNLINDILDLSKIDAQKLSLEKAPFQAESLLANIVSMLSKQAEEKGLDLELQSATLPVNLVGDATRLSQILINLVGNAIKFTEQGSITLRTTLLNEDDTSVQVRFDIIDTGIGIGSDAKDKVFREFDQADSSMTRKYGGTGLGLAVSKKLVEAMNGEIGFESEPEKGSTFWFSIPLGKSDEIGKPFNEQFKDDAEKIIQRDHTGARLLLVEDEPVNQEVAIGLLVAVGLDVVTADNGVEAVKAIERNNDYDLVLMDLQMPEMDGLEATRKIRQLPNGKNLPILAMTANAFQEDRIACEQAGMVDFVVKPVDPINFYGTLNKWLPKSSVNQQKKISEQSFPAPPSGSTEVILDDIEKLVLLNGRLLDMELGMRSLNGNLMTYIKLVKQFITSHKNDSAKLEECLRNDMQEDARRLAHTVKGAAGTLGLFDLQEKAAELESKLKLGFSDNKLSNEVINFNTALEKLYTQLS